LHRGPTAAETEARADQDHAGEVEGERLKPVRLFEVCLGDGLALGSGQRRLGSGGALDRGPLVRLQGKAGGAAALVFEAADFVGRERRCCRCRLGSVSCACARSTTSRSAVR
jgi:hypothetical protein